MNQISDLARQLELDASQLYDQLERRRPPASAHASLDRSTDWLRHCFRAMLMATTELRNADDHLRRRRARSRRR